MDEDSDMQRDRPSNGDVLCGAFHDHFDRLHLPAFLITGSQEIAGECVLEAFDRMRGPFLPSPAFALRAAKRSTIKSALRRVSAEIQRDATQCAGEENLREKNQSTLCVHKDVEVSRTRFLMSFCRLNAFYRAVLILRTYEHYPFYEAGLLLRLPVSRIRCGNAHAIALLVSSIHGADTPAPAGNVLPFRWPIHGRHGSSASTTPISIMKRH
jgi:DNA-directed RNA polymerase specialized sigma24 family protein